jgi:hypothetical protein
VRPRLHGRRPHAAHAARILPPGEPRRGQRLGARDHARVGAAAAGATLVVGLPKVNDATGAPVRLFALM